MHAYIILGSDSEQIQKAVEKITSSRKDHILQFPVQKIADVHELRKTLKVSQAELLYIKLSDFDNVTTEAQNAFLKNLEEPPSNVIFILTAFTETGILPTILSRCQIVRAGNSKVADDGSFEEFYKSDIFGRLAIIDKYKKREDAVYFIKNAIGNLHERVKLNSLGNKDQKALKAAEKTIYALNANGNVYLQLLNFAVSLN